MSDIQPDMQIPQSKYQLLQPDDQVPVQTQHSLNAEETKALFQRHAAPLFAYLRQHTASREDAEDLLHEIFAAAMGTPSFIQLDDVQRAQWLWRVARNKAVDTYRRKTRRPALALDVVVEQLYEADEQSPEYTAQRREEYAHLLAALQRLPAVQQEALRLRFVNELPCAEIAQVLGKREGAVRSLLSRAIARLRTIYTSGKEEL